MFDYILTAFLDFLKTLFITYNLFGLEIFKFTFLHRERNDHCASTSGLIFHTYHYLFFLQFNLVYIFALVYKFIPTVKKFLTVLTLIFYQMHAGLLLIIYTLHTCSTDPNVNKPLQLPLLKCYV